MSAHKDRLKVYWQTLLAGLRAAAWKLTNWTKIYNIKEGSEKSPASYLERLPLDSLPPLIQSVILAYTNQAAPDIKKKWYSLERLGE